MRLKMLLFMYSSKILQFWKICQLKRTAKYHVHVWCWFKYTLPCCQYQISNVKHQILKTRLNQMHQIQSCSQSHIMGEIQHISLPYWLWQSMMIYCNLSSPGGALAVRVPHRWWRSAQNSRWNKSPTTLSENLLVQDPHHRNIGLFSVIVWWS